MVKNIDVEDYNYSINLLIKSLLKNFTLCKKENFDI